MTLWSDEDLIRGKPDSVPYVFIVLSGFWCLIEI